MPRADCTERIAPVYRGLIRSGSNHHCSGVHALYSFEKRNACVVSNSVVSGRSRRKAEAISPRGNEE